MTFNELDDDDLHEEAPPQPPLYLLTGLILGLLVGIFIARVVSPLQYVDTAPATLAESYKTAYRLLIAQAYQANGNLERARQRLYLLDGDQAKDILSRQAQQWLAAGNNLNAARALAQLAADLEQPNPSTPPISAPTLEMGAISTPPLSTLDLHQAIATPTPSPSPTLTPTPWPTFTPRPSPTPNTAVQSPFKLIEQRSLCEPGVPQGLLQVFVSDRNGQPLAGVPIVLLWSSGQNVFYTGFYPAISPGYADAFLEPDTVYDVRAGDFGETVRGLQAPQCKTPDGQTFIGGWRLEFSQP